MPIEYKPKVKFFITTKADLATDKVNKWLEDNDNHIDVIGIQPLLSYAEIKDTGVYMIGCMITYLEVENEDEEDNRCAM